MRDEMCCAVMLRKMCVISLVYEGGTRGGTGTRRYIPNKNMLIFLIYTQICYVIECEWFVRTGFFRSAFFCCLFLIIITIYLCKVTLYM